MGSTPVAVDLLPDATSLADFVHPKNAYYIFGPEDGTLGKRITNVCKFKVFIPTRYCINLAGAVYIILYDRLIKMGG